MVRQAVWQAQSGNLFVAMAKEMWHFFSWTCQICKPSRSWLTEAHILEILLLVPRQGLERLDCPIVSSSPACNKVSQCARCRPAAV